MYYLEEVDGRETYWISLVSGGYESTLLDDAHELTKEAVDFCGVITGTS